MTPTPSSAGLGRTLTTSTPGQRPALVTRPAQAPDLVLFAGGL